MECRRMLEGEKYNKARVVENLQRMKKTKYVNSSPLSSPSKSSTSTLHLLDVSSSASSLAGDQASIYNNEIKALSKLIVDLKETIKRNEIDHAEKTDSIKYNNKDELSRIEDKISLVKRRKQEVLTSLRHELQELQKSNRDLQSLLDLKRERKTAASKK